MRSVLCVGGPKHGEYVQVEDPFRGLNVAIPDSEPWRLGWGHAPQTTGYYRMDKFCVTGSFIAPVFVYETVPDNEVTTMVLPLIFKGEFLATGV